MCQANRATGARLGTLATCGLRLGTSLYRCATGLRYVPSVYSPLPHPVTRSLLPVTSRKTPSGFKNHGEQSAPSAPAHPCGVRLAVSLDGRAIFGALAAFGVRLAASLQCALRPAFKLTPYATRPQS